MSKPKRVVVSRDEMLNFLEYVPGTGDLVWTINEGNARKGKPAGGLVSGYRQITFGGFSEYAHRVVWRIHSGAWPTCPIDHINGIRTDNRIENLRAVSPQENAQNLQGAHSDSKTGFLGVFRKRDKFVAQICVGGKKFSLGTFNTAEEASSAYIAAKRARHAGNTL